MMLNPGRNWFQDYSYELILYCFISSATISENVMRRGEVYLCYSSN